MNLSNGVELVPFYNLNETEKSMVLSWRNHDEIRRWMHNKELIKLEDHLNFISLLPKLKEKEYFLVKKEDDYIGVVNFTNIDEKNRSCELGLYVNPFMEIKGVGSLLMTSLLEYAFDILRMDIIKLEVYKLNNRAINLYKKYQFHKLNEEKEMIYMELRRENRKF